MSKISELKKEKKPEKNTIEAIEWLLDLAKEGEIIGLTYALQHADGLTSYGEVGILDWQPNRMTGAIENMKLRYQLNHCIEYVPE